MYKTMIFFVGSTVAVAKFILFRNIRINLLEPISGT